MMDFEGSPSSGVVEFGVVILENGEIRETHTALCKPTGSISERDREVHGISEQTTRSKQPFSDAYEQFTAFRREGVFAAHNRHAENSFLKKTWAVPPAVPDWRGNNETAQEWGPWIDTLSIYRVLYRGLESYGLGELVDAFNLRASLEELSLERCPEGRQSAHCALYDALASALLLLRLESEDSLRGRISIPWLLELSDQADAQQELF
ncbi:3'-5' exonuclease [Puniceicoccales bacterium CK1056]|uniref:3'-5' exonuclease n=1 Tax=Oceanipulchritudo coccoides TaxID=2706888 RepID=A0A6B2M0S6_9BACT|nr:3'-5' exonuclease [Oceanipulchritudo coccoides]NDV62571.1 3'-5' exonuclease [Oceanipulchritudo coccoides]